MLVLACSEVGCHVSTPYDSRLVALLLLDLLALPAADPAQLRVVMTHVVTVLHDAADTRAGSLAGNLSEPLLQDGELGRGGGR